MWAKRCVQGSTTMSFIELTVGEQAGSGERDYVAHAIGKCPAVLGHTSGHSVRGKVTRLRRLETSFLFK